MGGIWKKVRYLDAATGYFQQSKEIYAWKAGKAFIKYINNKKTNNGALKTGGNGSDLTK